MNKKIYTLLLLFPATSAATMTWKEFFLGSKETRAVLYQSEDPFDLNNEKVHKLLEQNAQPSKKSNLRTSIEEVWKQHRATIVLHNMASELTGCKEIPNKYYNSMELQDMSRLSSKGYEAIEI